MFPDKAQRFGDGQAGTTVLTHCCSAQILTTVPMTTPSIPSLDSLQQGSGTPLAPSPGGTVIPAQQPILMSAQPMIIGQHDPNSSQPSPQLMMTNYPTQ
jgi:hypothetical protein